jgi:stage V sporulation protein B
MASESSESSVASAAAASATPAKPDDAAASAGRGVAFIGAAKMYFILAGLAIDVGLPRLLNSVSQYGAYQLINSVVSWINNVLVTGTIQAVSRQTTSDQVRAESAKATGLKMQLRFGVPIAILYALLAPLWAYLLHDRGKTLLFALSGAIAGGYSIYAVLVGSANGTRQFHKQAGLDMTFATLRTIALLGAAALGLGVVGAIGGWIGAVLVITAIAFTWVGPPRGAKADPVMPLMGSLLGLGIYLLATNLFLFADSFLLKRLAAEWFHAHGHDYATAAHEADGQVGYYAAAQKLARLPYQLMIAVTFVIFPLISQATFENDKAKAASYVRTTMRLSLVFTGALGAVLAAHPQPLIQILFPGDYGAVAGPALSALALGHVAFVIFIIGGTMLNGAGHTFDAIIGAVVPIVVLAVSLWLTLPRLAPGSQMLLGAGACTAAAMLLGALVTGAQLRHHFGVFLPALTALRVVLATAAAILVCRYVPRHGFVMAVAGALAALVAYGVTLVVTGELGRADLERVLAVARRRRKA